MTPKQMAEANAATLLARDLDAELDAAELREGHTAVAWVVGPWLLILVGYIAAMIAWGFR